MVTIIVFRPSPRLLVAWHWPRHGREITATVKAQLRSFSGFRVRPSRRELCLVFAPFERMIRHDLLSIG